MSLAAGCSDDSESTKTRCLWKYDKEQECPDEDELGNADEVGDGDGDAPHAEDDDAASHVACATRNEGVQRAVYQCKGTVTVSMQFNTLIGNCAKTLGNPDFCRETHVFGHEPYAMPRVLACCDANDVPESELLQHCAMDLVEQVCSSIPLRLKSLIDNDVIKVGQNQAGKLQEWLEQNRQSCYDELYRWSGTPGVLKRATWRVNNGRNRQWPLLNNFTIILEEGNVEAATLPEDQSERLTCFDNSLNNGEIFEDRQPDSPGTIQVELAGCTSPAPISGPPLPNHQQVSGTATIASRGSQCAEPRCSWLAVSTDSAAGTLVLGDMNLFADGPTSLEVGPWAFAIDDAALRLYGASQGSWVDLFDDSANPRSAYVIDPGAAHFVIHGITGGEHERRWATNSGPIVLHESGGAWTIESFSVTHVDVLGQAWSITIPETDWN
ncbi:MAG: hypothetical protein R6X02_20170 [Enhygromyxa sp.]